MSVSKQWEKVLSYVQRATADRDRKQKMSVKSTRKKKKENDDDETMSMTTTTDTTETTLVDTNEFNQSSGGVSSWEFEELKKEADRLREKCDKIEKEKAEILSRRVASLDAPKFQSSEFLKLQQKVNQLTCANEDLKDEQKHYEAKIRELEKDLAARPSPEISQRQIAELRSKLSSAEGLIDQLHEEKREAVQQMKEMREEFEEMQDNFREEQAEEFASLKKELDEASKNCRLLQFKLRKVEKRADTLEAEKTELEAKVDTAKNASRIAKLEEELAKTKSEYEKLLKDGPKGKGSLSPSGLKKKSPVLTKAPSGEAVEPPTAPGIDQNQLLRDLQSTLERESDMREQLKFAEEEVMSLRTKINRIEDENESLSIQIKKMSAKPKIDSKTGKFIETTVNGDKLDAAELKLQLDVNEQESKILRRKIEELESSNAKLTKELQKAQEQVQSLEKGTSSVTKSKSVDEVSVLRRKVIEKEREIERLETELLAVASKNKGKINRVRSTESDDEKKKESEMKLELKKVQTELAKTKSEAEVVKKSLSEELTRTKSQDEENRSKIMQLAEMNRNLVSQMEVFKKEMVSMKEQYEAIQDDFVIKNSQLANAKEERDNALKKLKQEHDTISKELKALRETFNTRQDTWIKEKLALQEKMKELEEQKRKMSNVPMDRDSMRYKRLLDEKSAELDARNQEMGSYKDQILCMQKENDELRRKLDDFEKLSQMQLRTMSITSEPNSRSDRELKVLREKLLAEEKSHRNEVAQIKLRYDQQFAQKTEEISSLQAQVSRAKRERDTFRQMVDSAQRAISELKSRNNTASSRESISGLEEAATGARAAVVSLQERIVALEDELSEARRETARARTEIATEKSTWEMQLGEMQQKINELEEDRLLGAGRSRAAGQRTRLELAWQKEREEQQRRLKEATTLARDLKTTLQEFERERERERAETKRRMEQLKVSIEEDQEELRRKVGDYQADLLELRDAHAKLRTANEKLRRDREKLERERDAQVKREIEIRRVHSEREKMLDNLITTINASASAAVPSNSAEILSYLQGIKGLKEPEEFNNYKEMRRSNFRRAASAGGQDERQSQESLMSSVSSHSYYGREQYGGMKYNKMSANNTSTLTLPSRSKTPVPGAVPKVVTPDSSYNPKGSLNRKSLSLEQTISMPDDNKIWRGNSDAGSASSIPSMDGQLSRGSSIDRMSTISSKSEKPKNRSLVGKMKKLVKSRSIEESPTASRVVQAGVQVAGVGSSAGAGSNSSLNYESDRENPGKKLKDKVKGIFKRASRSPSTERRVQPPPTPPPRSSRESTPKKDTHGSTQRPLMPTESQQRPLMPSKR